MQFEYQGNNQLKQDLLDLRQSQSQYLVLNDKVGSLQDQYNSLLQAKSEKESQIVRAAEQYQTAIIQINQELGLLSIQQKRLKSQFQRAKQEQHLLHASLLDSNQKLQIAANQALQRQHICQDLDRQNQGLSNRLKQLKSSKLKLEQECQQLAVSIHQINNKIRELDSGIQVSESNKSRLSQSISIANRDFQDLNSELKEKEEACARADHLLKMVSQQLDSVRYNVSALQNQCQQHKQASIILHKQLQTNSQRSQELQNLIKVRAEQNSRKQEQLKQLMGHELRLQQRQKQLQEENNYLLREIQNCVQILKEYQGLTAQIH